MPRAIHTGNLYMYVAKKNAFSINFRISYVPILQGCTITYRSNKEY